MKYTEAQQKEYHNYISKTFEFQADSNDPLRAYFERKKKKEDLKLLIEESKKEEEFKQFQEDKRKKHKEQIIKTLIRQEAEEEEKKQKRKEKRQKNKVKKQKINELIKLKSYIEDIKINMILKLNYDNTEVQDDIEENFDGMTAKLDDVISLYIKNC